MLGISAVNGNHWMNEACENYISVFTQDILASDAFYHCNNDVLKHILQLDSMTCNEFILLDACLKWACKCVGIDENNTNNWRAQLGSCFTLIRFGTMDISEFAQHVFQYKKMFTSDELVDVLFRKVSGSSKFEKRPRSEPYSEIDKPRI